MQIVKKNLKQGEVVIKVDNPEDLWHIYQLVSEGDLVSSKTERKIKIGDGDDRKQTVVKKTVYIQVSVEKIEFHKHSNNLRISGKVTEGPDDVPHGSYHTLDAEDGTVLTVKKEEWMKYQLEKLSEAASSVKQKVLILVFDREEAIFSILKGQGYEILRKLKGDVSKKRFDSGDKKSFYSEISKTLAEYNSRLKLDSIIVASPSFWKEYLMKEVPDDLKKKITLAVCSDVDENAVPEVMKRPEVAKVLHADRAAKELSLIDNLLKNIAKDEACYGMKDCEDKIDIGAVKELLVSYEFLNKCRLNGTGKKVDKLMRLCESRDGMIHILSTDSADKKLSGLGGIAGVLRWKTN